MSKFLITARWTPLLLGMFLFFLILSNLPYPFPPLYRRTHSFNFKSHNHLSFNLKLLKYLQSCQTMDGSWYWWFVLPFLPLLSWAFSSFCVQVNGQKKRHINFHSCCTKRNQGCVRFCICTLHWRLFHFGYGRGNLILYSGLACGVTVY